MNQIKNAILTEVEKNYSFGCEMEDIQTVMFEAPVAPMSGADREILASVEFGHLALELNLYPSEMGVEVKPGVYAYPEYYVCICSDGEWESYGDLMWVSNKLGERYSGIQEPTITSQTTMEDLRLEMSQVLTELLTLI